MKQKYPNKEVIAPGTVIISAAGNCNNISKVVEPVLQKNSGPIYYINLSNDSHQLGGSSFAQTQNKIGTTAPDVTNSKKIITTFNTIQQLIQDDHIVAGHDISAGGLLTTLLEMCFADEELSAQIDLSSIGEEDSIKLLFSENCGIVFQAKSEQIEQYFKDTDIAVFKIGTVRTGQTLLVKNNSFEYVFNIPKLRDTWFETSHLLDQKQSGVVKAKERFENYKNQTLQFKFPDHFTGLLPKIDSSKPKPKAAILREKGSNSEREMAHAMYLAGFDVKDVHMTDLISGRETLEDIQFIGAVGGFSNSDVLGSAKGWAGAFMYNEKAKASLEKFFAREDVLSVGICNGCQLFVELNLINSEHTVSPKMAHNDSNKHESGFTSVEILENTSVMLSSLAGSKLGVWISHGEGKFILPLSEDQYQLVAKYGYQGYPANPNGSDYNTAMMCNADGRHLVMMPHIERSIFQWNWANYPAGRKDEVSPWIEAFVNARKWIENKK